MNRDGNEVVIAVDEKRSITVPVGAEMNAIRHAATSDNDYRLSEIEPIQEDRGSQRDPWVVTTGVKLIFERVG